MGKEIVEGQRDKANQALANVARKRSRRDFRANVVEPLYVDLQADEQKALKAEGMSELAALAAQVGISVKIV